MLVLAAGRACNATGAICTADGKQLSQAVTFTVPSDQTEPLPAAELTAQARSVPDSHNGNPFSFELRFSKEPSLSYVTVRDTAFEVTGATVTSAWRNTPGSDSSWTILVTPSSASSDVVLVLAGGRACGSEGAICTANGQQLSGTLTITVPR